MFSSVDDQPFLINASPDLRFQIESERALWPRRGVDARDTPIAGIILTSADLDQVLGLLLMREFQPLTVYATSLVRRTLESNSFFKMLDRVPNQLNWREIIPGQPFVLGEGLFCTPVAVAGSLPFYAQDAKPIDVGYGQKGTADGDGGQAVIGLVVESHGYRIAYTPSLPEVTEELRLLYDSCDLVLVDGTFWSNSELRQTHPGTPLARSIGHLPVGGVDGTMAELAAIKRPQKVFIHLNNTNPMIDPESEERRLVEQAGWQVAHDGWEWEA